MPKSAKSKQATEKAAPATAGKKLTGDAAILAKRQQDEVRSMGPLILKIWGIVLAAYNVHWFFIVDQDPLFDSDASLHAMMYNLSGVAIFGFAALLFSASRWTTDVKTGMFIMMIGAQALAMTKLGGSSDVRVDLNIVPQYWQFITGCLAAAGSGAWWVNKHSKIPPASAIPTSESFVAPCFICFLNCFFFGLLVALGIFELVVLEEPATLGSKISIVCFALLSIANVRFLI